MEDAYKSLILKNRDRGIYNLENLKNHTDDEINTAVSLYICWQAAFDSENEEIEWRLSFSGKEILKKIKRQSLKNHKPQYREDCPNSPKECPQAFGLQYTLTEMYNTI